MSRTTENEYRRSQLLIATIYILLVGILGAATAVAETEERISASKHIVTGGRDGGGAAVETNDVYGPLATDGKRLLSPAAKQASSGQSTGSGTAPPAAMAGANDFWIYDADVVLFGDDDNDGYFFGIDLLIDADTVWSSADVYGVLYLSLDGGPWNEYAVTEEFRIAGARADDEFVIVTELQSGYPTGDYDLLIELFSAETGEFLADFGPEANSSLGFLPLEDFNRDAPSFDTPVTVSRSSGGGSTGVFSLLLLLGVVLLSRFARPALRLARVRCA